jgi:isopentenyldiphosphate isomerase
MSDERIIIVDRNDHIIGHKAYGTLTDEDIYRVAALWLTNSRHQILLAQRSWSKHLGPGEWGPAAAGTLEEGETYEANTYKEAEEEIGLTGVTFSLGPKQFRDSGQQHKYFVQWYLASLDRDLGDFTIQEAEVEQIKWIGRAELLRDLEHHPEKYNPAAAIGWQELIEQS